MAAVDHETLFAVLTRLKLTAIRDGLDTLLDEAARRDLTLRGALAFSASGSRRGRMSAALRWR